MRRLALLALVLAGCDDFDELEAAALDAGRLAGGGAAGGASGGMTAGGMTAGGASGGMTAGGASGGMTAGGSACSTACPPVDAGCGTASCMSLPLPGPTGVGGRGLGLATTGSLVFIATEEDGGFSVQRNDGGAQAFPGALVDLDARLGGAFVISSVGAHWYDGMWLSAPLPDGASCQTGAVYSNAGTNRVAYCVADGGYAVHTLAVNMWPGRTAITLPNPTAPQASLVRPNGSDGALIVRQGSSWVFAYVTQAGTTLATDLPAATAALVASSEAQQALAAARTDAGLHLWQARGRLPIFPPPADAGSLDITGSFELQALAVNENQVQAVLVKSLGQQSVRVGGPTAIPFEANHSYLLTLSPVPGSQTNDLRVFVTPLGTQVSRAWLGFTDPVAPALHMLISCSGSGTLACSGASTASSLRFVLSIP